MKVGNGMGLARLECLLLIVFVSVIKQRQADGIIQISICCFPDLLSKIDQQASVFLALKLVDINDKSYWSMHILHLIARLVMKVGILIPAKFSHHAWADLELTSNIQHLLGCCRHLISFTLSDSESCPRECMCMGAVVQYIWWCGIAAHQVFHLQKLWLLFSLAGLIINFTLQTLPTLSNS